MFSANENLMLRQHKRRIVQQIESMIPDEEILDLGTTVMVMEVKCNTPGCVPIETAIIIVFPPSPDIELIKGLPESKSQSGSKTGSNYKTKILKPMKDVTELDIREALPPAFKGGLRTMEKLCLNARDIMISQITQLFGPTTTTTSTAEGSGASIGGSFAQTSSKVEEEDVSAMNDRKLMAQYLQQCLQDYINNNCIPPEWGQPFPSNVTAIDQDKDKDDNANDSVNVDVDANGGDKKPKPMSVSTTTTTISDSAVTTVAATTTTKFPDKGNFVIQRNVVDVSNSNKAEERIRTGAASKGLTFVTSSSSVATASESTSALSSEIVTPSSYSTTTTKDSTTSKPTNNRTTTVLSSVRSTQTRQATTKAIANATSGSVGSGAGGGNISQLFNREHAPGIRQPGCPCCDPDNPNNVLDKMMTMM